MVIVLYSVFKRRGRASAPLRGHSSPIQPELSMVNGFSFSRHGRRRQAITPHAFTPRALALRAFTLAELLIVIAIIAVLISVLLPSLAAARRSAATVKCLSSLRNIGSAFQMYAQDNHRFFPVVRWCPGPAANTSHPEWGPGVSSTESVNTTERNWIDMLSKYLLKQPTYGDPKVYGLYQNTSVFWGCPAYSADNWVQTATNGQQNSLSYGMSLYPIGPYRNNSATLAAVPDSALLSFGGLGPASTGNVAYIANGASPIPAYAQGGGKGQFFKMEQWGRHGQDKGIIADSNGFDLIASNNWTKADDLAAAANVGVEPAIFLMPYPHVIAGLSSYISVDSTRHLAPTTDKKKALHQRGVNMLFVDGHATTVTPREAWIATMGGGMDTTQ